MELELEAVEDGLDLEPVESNETALDLQPVEEGEQAAPSYTPDRFDSRIVAPEPEGIGKRFLRVVP